LKIRAHPCHFLSPSQHPQSSPPLHRHSPRGISPRSRSYYLPRSTAGPLRPRAPPPTPHARHHHRGRRPGQGTAAAVVRLSRASLPLLLLFLLLILSRRRRLLLLLDRLLGHLLGRLLSAAALSLLSIHHAFRTNRRRRMPPPRHTLTISLTAPHSSLPAPDRTTSQTDHQPSSPSYTSSQRRTTSPSWEGDYQIKVKQQCGGPERASSSAPSSHSSASSSSPVIVASFSSSVASSAASSAAFSRPRLSVYSRYTLVGCHAHTHAHVSSVSLTLTPPIGAGHSSSGGRRSIRCTIDPNCHKSPCYPFPHPIFWLSSHITHRQRALDKAVSKTRSLVAHAFVVRLVACSP